VNNGRSAFSRNRSHPGPRLAEKEPLHPLLRKLRIKTARLLGCREERGLYKSEEPRAFFVRCKLFGGVPALMPQTDEYRRFAQECLEMSKTVQDERSRAVLIQMAQVWFRLAQEKLAQEKPGEGQHDNDR
jgi:hypothetical protein